MLRALIALTFAAVLISGVRCEATQIAVIACKDGIVVAADSKQGFNSNLPGFSHEAQTAEKLFLADNKVAFAIVGAPGTHIFDSQGTNLYSFDFLASFNKFQQDTLPRNASIFTVESGMKEILKKFAIGLGPYITNGTFEPADFPGGHVITIVLMGYVGKTPTIRVLSLDCDWQTKDILLPQSKTVKDRSFVLFGWNRAIEAAYTDPQSQERRIAAKNYPKLMKGIDVFYMRRVVNTVEAEGIVIDCIRFASKFDEEKVGPPIQVDVITSLGARPLKTFQD